MSSEAAAAFMKAFDETLGLQAEFAAQHFEPDNPAENWKRFLDLAARAGYVFTIAELTAAVKAQAEQQKQPGELSAEDLEQMAGG